MSDRFESLTNSIDERDSTTVSPVQPRSSYVVDEFVQSEASYRAAMDVLLKAYVLPLFNTAECEAMQKGFGADLFEIIACHEMIKKKLEQESSSFSETLLALAPSLQHAYTKYVINFGKNSMEIEGAKTQVGEDMWSSGMCAIATGMKSATPLLQDVDVSFGSLVAMPMQRLVRYSLLCEQFIKLHDAKEADDSAQEITQAREAAAAIKDMCSAMNESKEMMINTRKLLEIERDYCMYGISLDPERRLLNEGRFTRATKQRGDSYKFRSCQVFLFNDKLSVVKIDDSGNVKKIDELPLHIVSSVRNLRSDRSHKFHETLSGVVILHSDPFKSSGADQELLLCDDDELNVGIWQQDISQAVQRACYGKQ